MQVQQSIRQILLGNGQRAMSTLSSTVLYTFVNYAHTFIYKDGLTAWADIVIFSH